MSQYRLKCSHCGLEQDDDGFRLQCREQEAGRHGPALLRPVFASRQLSVRTELPGIFKYIDWLPTNGRYFNTTSPALGSPYTYRSHGLGRRLGLNNLYIAFSGYWPERGAMLLTRTFKEFETQAGIARYLKSFSNKDLPLLLVCSAGNTANAYNLLSHALGLPIILVVPETALDNLVLPVATKPFTIAVKGTYSDSIELSDRIAAELGLFREGGVFNVARRSGMGTVMLHAVAHPEEGAGQLFDHYFQAVGSASGALGAHESCELLRQDGRFGDRITHIHMAQNYPFVPIVEAWNEASGLKDIPDDLARERIGAVTATVLTNRKPPYTIPGGIAEVLRATGGMAWSVSNFRLFHAARTFKAVEGIDIGPAAAVATDALFQAVEAGAVKRDDRVLLHITGGGREIQNSEAPVHQVRPSITLERTDIAGALKAVQSSGLLGAAAGPRPALLDVTTQEAA